MKPPELLALLLNNQPESNPLAAPGSYSQRDGRITALRNVPTRKARR